MLNVIFTIFFVAYFLISAPILVAISALLFVLCYPFDPQRKVQHHFSTFISMQYFVLSPFAKVIVKGTENVKNNTPYVICSNHQSMLDIVLLYNVKTYFRWVSKKEIYRTPLVGQLLLLHGDVTIKRGNTKSTKKMIQDCSGYLQKGISIMMFPEGTRSKNGQVGRFKEGAFILAKLNKVSILPVAIDGTRQFSNGNGGWLNARQLFQITIMPAIPAEEVASTDVRVMQEKVHDIILEKHKKTTPSAYRQHSNTDRNKN
ncbi:MAG: 1-acyl-sn-glycerol-3-phosphate acyltransferase [Prevotellaceae bacterium]|jgi:1-acyl-sn-glycerol-3-phosphate acyltransferase|nr:1-acyl-sn-glycerol-3-phosphate acyltransferase [Prevotellaceae bacterium]